MSDDEQRHSMDTSDALTDQFHDAQNFAEPIDHTEDHDQRDHDSDDHTQREGEGDYAEEDADDEEDEFHDSDPGPDEEQPQDPSHESEPPENVGHMFLAQHELHATGPDLAPPPSSPPALGPSASLSRGSSSSAPATPEPRDVTSLSAAGSLAQGSVAPVSDTYVPQVVVTPTSPIQQPELSSEPQVIVVQSPPSPPVAQAPPQVLLQSGPPTAVSPPPMVPQQQQMYTQSYTVPTGVTVVQPDHTEQNIHNIYSNISTALFDHPRTASSSSPLSGSSQSGAGSGSRPPPQSSPSPGTPVSVSRRTAQQQSRNPTRATRTVQSPARVPVPLSSPGASTSRSQLVAPRQAARDSPPRQLPQRNSPPLSSVAPASPPPTGSHRSSSFIQATPVATPIVEHPEYEYEEQQSSQFRGQLTEHVRNDSVQTGESEVPPPPPPASEKPQLSRPPSLSLVQSTGGPYDANANATMEMYQSPVSASPAHSRQSTLSPPQQAYFIDQQEPHMNRRTTVGHSGLPQQPNRPPLERRGVSYDERLQTQYQQQAVYQQAEPQRSAPVIHASVPVGGVVNGRMIAAAQQRDGGASAEVDFDGRGVQVHMNPGNVAALPGAAYVRQEAGTYVQHGSEVARHGVDVARQALDPYRQQGTDAYRQGSETVRQGFDTYRQGLDTVRQGLDDVRQNTTRAVSFVEHPQQALSASGFNSQNLLTSAGGIAANFVLNHGGHHSNGDRAANGHSNGSNFGSIRQSNGSPPAVYGNGNGLVNGHLIDGRLSRASGVDTLIGVPLMSSPPSKPSGERTVEERLKPTLDNAKIALGKARVQAKITGWSLNVAIGAQVLLGALTTGIAAATTGKTTSVVTSILGGISTLAASYLAKARGSGEPEHSSQLAKDLENYVRDCDAFVLDYGHMKGEDMREHVEEYRRRFEILMGHNGDQVGDHVEEKKVFGSMHAPSIASDRERDREFERYEEPRGGRRGTQGGSVRTANGSTRDRARDRGSPV